MQHAVAWTTGRRHVLARSRDLSIGVDHVFRKASIERKSNHAATYALLSSNHHDVFVGMYRTEYVIDANPNDVPQKI